MNIEIITAPLDPNAPAKQRDVWDFSRITNRRRLLRHVNWALSQGLTVHIKETLDPITNAK